MLTKKVTTNETVHEIKREDGSVLRFTRSNPNAGIRRKKPNPEFGAEPMMESGRQTIGGFASFNRF